MTPLADIAHRPLGSPQARSDAAQTLIRPLQQAWANRSSAYRKKMSPNTGEGVLRRLQPRVGPKLIRRLPKLVLQFTEVCRHVRPSSSRHILVAATGPGTVKPRIAGRLRS